VIGASTDGFQFADLKDKIQAFLNESGQIKNQAAQLWNILSGEKWRIEYILSEGLQEKWETISDAQEYTVDLSVSCALNTTEAPTQDAAEADEKFQERLATWRDKKANEEQRRDEVSLERQNNLEEFVRRYNGTLLSSFVEDSDSFGVRIKISGIGLKDIVSNYPFLFDVTEQEELSQPVSSTTSYGVTEATFETPDAKSPAICVIDSGLQQNHAFLQDAIQSNSSKSYVPNEPSTADMVLAGGHGTRVGGAVLFGNSIPRTGTHKHVAWLNNAKVLTNFAGQAAMPAAIYPPAIVAEITTDFSHCKIFNLSINGSRPCRLRHMSAWAAAIDRINWESDSLFVISAGNLKRESQYPNNPGVKEIIASGKSYPQYFADAFCRIANPAQAAFGLTVGSVCIDQFTDLNYASFGQRDTPSAFTRSGPGLWGMIKPDVVEYGGDFIRETNSSPNVSTHEATTPETVRSLLQGGPAVGRDQVGTSFSAPKVTHVIAKILNNWGNATSLFIRTLIAQSARWPEVDRNLSPVDRLKLLGYGIPSEARALDNSPQRITFVAENNIQPKKAHVYKIEIPAELRMPGDAYRYRIEVSLAYKAKIRRTRRGTKSYVSAWADWVSSKIGEADTEFRARVTKYTEAEEASREDTETIKWAIRERNDWGQVFGMKRNDSTLQKDWAFLNSYELPEHLSIAVVGHKGWEQDIYKEAIPYCFMISIECLEPQIEIYNSIRLHNRIEVEV